MSIKKIVNNFCESVGYTNLIVISMQELFQFKINSIITVVVGFISAYAKVCIWYVILENSNIKLSIQEINVTISYMLVVSSLYPLLYTISMNEMTTRNKSGNLDWFFLFPISFPLYTILKSMGNFIFTLITRSLPVFLLLLIIYREYLTFELINILPFIIFYFMGILIYACITVMLDMTTIWIVETNYLHFIKGAIIAFFSGSLLPFWFMPKQLAQICNILPFKYIMYLPISILTGKEDHLSITHHFIVGLLWTILFILMLMFFWNRAKKKVTIGGG